MSPSKSRLARWLLLYTDRTTLKNMHTPGQRNRNMVELPDNVSALRFQERMCAYEKQGDSFPKYSFLIQQVVHENERKIHDPDS